MSRRTSLQADVVPAPAFTLPGEDAANRMRLVHAFGVYPLAIRDAVISLGDDAFLFCAGRHIAVCDQVRHRLGFLPRAASARVITAAAKSESGKFIAVAERHGAEDASAQISIFHLPKPEGILDSLAGAKEEALRVLHPKNHRLDIVGLSFTPDAKHLVSLSAMPDTTITYWRWEADKAVSSHDIQLPVSRLHVNPGMGYQLSVSGRNYLRLWEYNPNDHQLREHPSVFPLKQERRMHVVDHCWVLNVFLCGATEDGHVHLFQDSDGHGQHEDVDVRAQIARDEAGGRKAVEREQAKHLQALMGVSGPGLAGDPPPVRLTALAAWGRGFVVGGDQGYLGVFKVDYKMQVEPFGTFRMPGEEDVVWQMSAGSEDTHLTIMSHKQQDADGESPMRASTRSSALAREASKGRALGSAGGDVLLGRERMWSLTTFPVGQADLAATGQLEVFAPVFPLGTHQGPVLSMGVSRHRHIAATCSSDMHLKVWSYPTEEALQNPNAFAAECSIHVSAYERPLALSVHPMGFQVAVLLESLLRIYHLVNQQVTRTLFDLPLRHPGDVAYSNGGAVLAVTTEHDVILLDPWRLTLVHMFSGRGGHLSAVNQVLFSEDDRMLLSCGAAPHGAIYGWDLESQGKDRVLEHVSKGTNYARLAHDFRRQLVVACVRPEGYLRVIDAEGTVQAEAQPEGRGAGYTAMCLAAAVGMLLAGTQQGSVCVFRWPLEGGAGARPVSEVALHAHSVSAMSLSIGARLLFSSCEGGAVLASELGIGAEDAERGGGAPGGRLTSAQLDAAFMRYRHKEDGVPNQKPVREEDRKVQDLQKKLLMAGHGMSANSAAVDELVLVPRSWLNDCLSEIKELEDRMQAQKRESDYALEQKEQDLQEQLQTIYQERRHEKGIADDKFDELFKRFKQTNERHGEAMGGANRQFDQRVREAQEENERRLSKEYEKQSRLLDELQGLRDQHEQQLRRVEQRHEAQLAELRGAQERAVRDWRQEHEKVCSLLKSDGLKFEEALRQQEREYEGQIFEIQEHKRVALQVESEKSTTALKDTVSMKQTINMLQGQLKTRRDELGETVRERDDLQKKLEEAREMFAKVNDQLREQKRSLAVKDESLRKVREQMKHLESFRFVLYHRLNALEEERDPLEEQVSSLKTSVREMYSEFVREFRQKQKLDQQLSDNTSLASALQKETIELRARMAQLKKDGRRLLQDVEKVLHDESTADFERLPKKLQTVLDRYSRLSQWAPPAEEPEKQGQAEAAEGQADAAGRDQMIIQEMQVQRDLLFRKNQIAVASANQTKKECSEDFRRLMSENAALIAEMNKLRNEKSSYQRSCKELEADLMCLRRKTPAEPAAHRSESAPDLGAGPGPGAPARGRSRPGAETPYLRRKVVDQQELVRRQRQRGANQLPPVGAPGAATAPAGAGRPQRASASAQEKRFARSLDSAQAGRESIERQGFDLQRLSDAAAQRPPQGEPAAPGPDGEAGGLPAGE